MKPLERKSVRYLGVEMPFADESCVASPSSPARAKTLGFDQVIRNSLSPTRAHPHVFADFRSLHPSPESDFCPNLFLRSPPRSPTQRRSISPLVRYEGPGGGEYKEKAAITARPVTLKTSWSPRAARKPKGLVPTVVVESYESPSPTGIAQQPTAFRDLPTLDDSIPPTPPQRPPPDESELLQLTIINDDEAHIPMFPEDADNASASNRLKVQAIEIIKRARSTSQGAISREGVHA